MSTQLEASEKATRNMTESKTYNNEELYLRLYKYYRNIRKLTVLLEIA